MNDSRMHPECITMHKWVSKYLQEIENEAGRLEYKVAQVVLKDLTLYVHEALNAQ